MSENISNELYSKIHQLMPIICVDCVVSCNGKIFLIKRKCEPMQDAWWFPGGRLIRDERIEHAVKRIVLSETNLHVCKHVLLGHDETMFNTDPFGHGNGTHTVNFVFATTVPEMDIMRVILDDNHLEHSLFSYDEIYQSNMHSYVKRFTALAEGIFRR